MVSYSVLAAAKVDYYCWVALTLQVCLWLDTNLVGDVSLQVWLWLHNLVGDGWFLYKRAYTESSLFEQGAAA